MKYNRPEDLDSPYPDNCHSCGATLTFRSVMEIVDVEAREITDLSFATATAFCKPCGQALQKEIIGLAVDEGLNISHVTLTPDDGEIKH